MTDVSITAANVISGSDAVVREGTAGATVTAGQAGYLDTATNTYKLADANAVGTAAAAGIFLNGASSGQPVKLQYGGELTAGGTVAAGIVYCVSETAGGIAPLADLGTGTFISILGVGISTTKIKMTILNSGVAKA